MYSLLAIPNTKPSSTPAFSNTIYLPNVMKKLQTNTPTSLIQTYYSCVLAPLPAIIQAVGIGTSSATFFVFLALAVYIFVLIQVLNRGFGAEIPSKHRMVLFLLLISVKMFCSNITMMLMFISVLVRAFVQSVELFDKTNEHERKIEKIMTLINAMESDAANGTVVRLQ